MRSTKQFLLCLLIMPILAFCQISKKQESIEQKIVEYKDYVIYEDQPKTGYYLQINSQNCHYDVILNDLSVMDYNSPFPVYSVRPPLNYEILKSGEQRLSIIMKPMEKGEMLSERAHINIRLMKYNDMTDKYNEFGGYTDILEWESPVMDKNLPIYTYQTVFNAEVPYERNRMDYAVDLSKMDEKELYKEVVERFELFHYYFLNDFDKFNEEARVPINNSHFAVYKTREDLEEVLLDNKNTLADPLIRDNLQPIKDFKLAFYGNNRVVTLKRLNDDGNIMWAKDPETGMESYYMPIYIYKDKRDNRWYKW